MSGPYQGAIDVGRVAKERKFNAGGQGAVWAVKDRTINGSWPVAYKEYHPNIRQELKADVLSGMVDFIPSLPRTTGQWLAECTAWPAVLVTDSAGVSGFLMRQIPAAFFCRLAFDPGEERPAGFQYLLNPPDYLRKAGITITPRQRFELLMDFAGTMARLHSLGVVVGDLSANNLLFSLSGQPRCFLIDCDAMGLNGRWALPAVETPNWGLPAGEQVGSPSGDVYKFGLLASRLFAGEQDGRDLVVLQSVSPAAGRLAERSLDVDPSLRPAAEDWTSVLAEAVRQAPATLPLPRTAPPPSAPPLPPLPQGGTVPQQAPFALNVPPVAPYRARTAPPRQGKPKAGRRIVAVLLVVLALVYGPDLYASMKEGARSESSGSSGASGQGDGSDSSTTSDQGNEEDQARALNSLLERNEGNRSDVGTAVSRMTTCPGRSGLEEAKTVFEDAATERTELVQGLEELDSGLLPASMTESLGSGWRASAEADQAYAQLARKLMSGCTPDDVTSSSQWQEASDASRRATREKKAFVSAWNPIAEENGLTTMSWDEV